MPNRCYLGGRRPLTKREARVLARFGDKLIADLRAQKKTTIRVKGAIAGSHDVDVGIGAARASKAFSAYFHYANHNPRIPIRLKVTDQKICNATLECRPLTR